MLASRTVIARTPARPCSHNLPTVLGREDAVCQYKFVDLMFFICKLSKAAPAARNLSKQTEPGS